MIRRRSRMPARHRWGIGALCGIVIAIQACSSPRIQTHKVRNAPPPSRVTLDLTTHPQWLEGTTNAAIPAAEIFGVPCHGYVGEEAEHALVVKESSAIQLDLITESDTDLTLVVSGKAATYCSDDDDGLLPGLQLFLTPGTYQIFVGTASRDTPMVPYRIAMDQADPFRPFDALSTEWTYKALQRQTDGRQYVDLEKIEDLEQRIQTQEEAMKHDVPIEPPRTHPRYGEVRVRQDVSAMIFDDDVVGNTDAPLWPLDRACGGYADQRGAELRLQVARGVDGLVQCAIDANRQVALAVRLPSGDWQCEPNDDRSATWQLESPSAGAYTLFVTTNSPWATWAGMLRCDVRDIVRP